MRRTVIVLGLIVLLLASVPVATAWQTVTYYQYYPIIRKDPTLTPTKTPLPTATSAPTATFAPVTMYTVQGFRGNYFRINERNKRINQDVWFDFSVTNTNADSRYIGGLGAVWCTSGSNCTQASWGDFIFGGTPTAPDGNLIEWNDHLNISTAGTYQVRFGICFLASRSQCEANPGSWQYLSSPITIYITN